MHHTGAYNARGTKRSLTHYVTLLDLKAKALVDTLAYALSDAEAEALRKFSMCRPRHLSTWCLTN